MSSKNNARNTIVCIIIALVGIVIGYLLNNDAAAVAAPVAVENNEMVVDAISGLSVQVAEMQIRLDEVAACACNAPVVQCGVVATITETIEVPTYIVVTETVAITNTTIIPTVVVTTPVPTTTTATPTSTPTVPSTSTREPTSTVVVTAVPPTATPVVVVPPTSTPVVEVTPEVTSTPVVIVEPTVEPTKVVEPTPEPCVGNPGNTKCVGKSGEKDDEGDKFNPPSVGGPGDKGASDGEKAPKATKEPKGNNGKNKS